MAQPGLWVDESASFTGSVRTEGETIVATNVKHGELPVRVEKLEPPTYLAYRSASAFPGQEGRAGTTARWWSSRWRQT